MTKKAITDREFSITSEEFLWENSGETEAHGYLLKPTMRLLKHAGAHQVLDVGCGNGHVTGQLGNNGFEAVGCDMSLSGLEIARKQFPQIRFFQLDLLAPLPDEHTNRYDAVVSLEVIEHLLLPRRLMSTAYAALRPGGTLILSTPYHGYWKNLLLAVTNKFDDHWHPLRDYGHIKFFSKRTIFSLFEEFGFSELSFVPAGRVPPLACSMIISGVKPP